MLFFVTSNKGNNNNNNVGMFLQRQRGINNINKSLCHMNSAWNRSKRTKGRQTKVALYE